MSINKSAFIAAVNQLGFRHVESHLCAANGRASYRFKNGDEVVLALAERGEVFQSVIANGGMRHGPADPTWTLEFLCIGRQFTCIPEDRAYWHDQAEYWKGEQPGRRSA